MQTMQTFHKSMAQSEDKKCLKQTVSTQLLSKKSEATIEFSPNPTLWKLMWYSK